MLPTRLPLSFALLSLLAAGSLVGQDTADAAKIARGKYLAEQVSKCQECHTPVLDSGELDKSQWMKGAPMPYAPIKPIANWHKNAPDITPLGALWERWGGEAALVKYLVTGLTPKGTKAGPPMPTYTMKQEDAEAIVAYLKSLQ